MRSLGPGTVTNSSRINAATKHLGGSCSSTSGFLVAGAPDGSAATFGWQDAAATDGINIGCNTAVSLNQRAFCTFDPRFPAGSLTVVGGNAEAVPTTDQWALWLMTLGLMMAGFVFLRRRSSD